MSSIEVIQDLFTQGKTFFTDVVYPNSKRIYSQINQTIFNVLKIQKEFDFLTNFLFFLILICLLYIFIRIYLKLRNCVFKFFTYIKYSLIDMKYSKKVNSLTRAVNENLIPFNKESKYKPIFEFKEEPMKLTDIIREINRAKAKDEGKREFPTDKISGKTFNDDGTELKNINYQGALTYSYSNLLHPDVFVSSRFFESELIKHMLSLFNGSDLTNCGITTYSNTESLILIFLAYKNLTNKHDPEILVSEACPAIYKKVALMTNIRLRFAPIDEEGKVIVDSFKNLIKRHKRNIIAAVGFVPNPCFGNADDIEKLSEICKNEDINMHVDASFGGFMAAFSRDHTLFKKFDFTLPGVSSIASDMSHFAKCPIGISFVGYRNREIRKKHYFTYSKWMGGMYASPTLPGSRVGSIVITSYITFLHLGLAKFRAFSKHQYDIIQELKNKINKTKDLQVVGNPTFNVLSITSKTISLSLLDEEMRKLKWDLTLSYGDTTKSYKKQKYTNPLSMDSLNLIITFSNIDTINEVFINDLTNALQAAKERSKDYKESKVVSTLRSVSELPCYYQKRVLESFVSTKTDFKN